MNRWRKLHQEFIIGLNCSKYKHQIIVRGSRSTWAAVHVNSELLERSTAAESVSMILLSAHLITKNMVHSLSNFTGRVHVNETIQQNVELLPVSDSRRSSAGSAEVHGNVRRVPECKMTHSGWSRSSQLLFHTSSKSKSTKCYIKNITSRVIKNIASKWYSRLLANDF